MSMPVFADAFSSEPKSTMLPMPASRMRAAAWADRLPDLQYTIYSAFGSSSAILASNDASLKSISSAPRT